MSEIKKNILVCPLDWGLGHATRCVPIINKFITKGANVIIAADGRALAFLQKEFPSLESIRFPGYEVTYPDKGSMTAKMFFSSFKILKRIKNENKFLQNLIEEHHIDIVISDNRYGLWSKKAKCVFITHQLAIKCPGWLKIAEYVLLYLNKYYINKYDECWVPDFFGEMNAGCELSKSKKGFFKNLYHIGILSRFNNELYSAVEKKYDVLFILSGPEPQRTIFENIIIDQAKSIIDKKMLIVRGITDSDNSEIITPNLSSINHLETEGLFKAISESAIIVCRPGYSSIMDIITLGKNAIFVPTPGQTEQEYLARCYKKRNQFFNYKQLNFNILKALDKARYYNGFKNKIKYETLDERIQLLLS